ncbi:MAG: GCN5-related N-acetyltransferase [Candidatus Solibacter sp.]|nr:GCN5-related N-acetyltransferase [Candidatus Solibacter sp.]
MFADLALAKRLERAEGYACMRFAAARRRLFPESGSEWLETGGAYVVFDGVESPVTQSFGLGLFEPLSAERLREVERFFFERGAPAMLEISPFAGVPAIDLLCGRGYRPVEISNVMWQSIEDSGAETANVRVIGPGESVLWNDVSARGWCHEHPELAEYFRQSGAISTAREGSVCFLAEVDGQPGAAGSLCLHDGVALLAGASTVPELRRRGLQGALLRERLRYAYRVGCDLAMMVAEVGSESQRNAERKGFRIAYTRTKWCLRKS